MKTTKLKNKKEAEGEYLRDEMDEGLQPLGSQSRLETSKDDSSLDPIRHF